MIQLPTAQIMDFAVFLRPALATWAGKAIYVTRQIAPPWGSATQPTTAAPAADLVSAAVTLAGAAHPVIPQSVQQVAVTTASVPGLRSACVIQDTLELSATSVLRDTGGTHSATPVLHADSVTATQR